MSQPSDAPHTAQRQPLGAGVDEVAQPSAHNGTSQHHRSWVAADADADADAAAGGGDHTALAAASASNAEAEVVVEEGSTLALVGGIGSTPVMGTALPLRISSGCRSSLGFVGVVAGVVGGGCGGCFVGAGSHLRHRLW